MLNVESIVNLALERKIDQYKADPWLWMCDQVYTFDEQSVEGKAKWPAHKEYLKYVIHELITYRFILMEKSRQMMATWMACAFLLWKEMFHTGFRSGVLSTKVETADAILEREYHIYKNQSPWLQRYSPCKRKEGWLTIDHSDGQSWGQAVTTSAASGRSFTFSHILIDEAAWQLLVRQAYTANLPAVQSKGGVWMFSSTQANTFFTELVDDLFTNEEEELNEPIDAFEGFNRGAS